MNNNNFTIFTFYQFITTENLQINKKIIKDFCSFHKIRGTILLAKEGINGTVAGFGNSISLFEAQLKKINFNKLEFKYSYYRYMPFNYLKVKIKNEIVTFSKDKLDVENSSAIHIIPENWNDLVKDKDTILIDVRNNFEIKMGSFENSFNPNTNKFSQFKEYVNKKLKNKKNKKIALYCTGGIRCEKASSYMIKQGFNNLFQLKGGILNYLNKIPKNNSIWKGECFVFDNRVSVKNELVKGSYKLCHACRMPLNINEVKSLKYEKGISCPYCFDGLTENKKKRLEDRNKQIEISKKRGLYNPYIKNTVSDLY